MVDVSDWARERKSTGSRSGYWLHDAASRQYLLKFPKTHQSANGSFTTGEVGAELLASRVGAFLRLPVPHVDVGALNGQVGALVKSFLGPGQELREGIDLARTMPRERLTLCRVLQCLGQYVDTRAARQSLVQMVCFDILVGNADRHQANWGVIVGNDRSVSIAPWYDNAAAFGSALDLRRARQRTAAALARFDLQFRYEILIQDRGPKPRLQELLGKLSQLDSDLAGFPGLMAQLTDQAIDTIVRSIADRERIMESDRWDLAGLILRRRRDILGSRGVG